MQLPDIGALLHDLLQGLIDGLMGIVQALLGVLMSVLAWVFSLLPDASDLGLSPGSGIILGYNWLDSFLPVHEIIAGIGLLVGVITLWVAAATVLFIYHQFWGSS